MFKIIRICNKAIGNIDRVQNIPSEQDKNDILGQAYFVRGFAHFVLCRYCGGVPYLDKALGSEDNWDQTRLSANENYTSTLAPSVPALMLCALMRRPVSHISVIASQVKRRLQLSR